MSLAKGPHSVKAEIAFPVVTSCLARLFASRGVVSTKLHFSTNYPIIDLPSGATCQGLRDLPAATVYLADEHARG
jgi:hypothetical protein